MIQRLCSYLRNLLILGLALGLAAVGQAQGCPSGKHKPMTLTTDGIAFDPGSVPASTLEKPLQKALAQLLEPDDELESPLNNARELAAGQANWSEDKAEQLELSRQLLSDYFHRSTTQLVLLEEGKEGRGFAPERGEDLKKNWVFSLIIPSLSDHIYWIVVSKEGPYKAYVYGFN